MGIQPDLILDDFADLESLLAEGAPSATKEEITSDEFSQLDALLEQEEVTSDEFSQLDALLEQEEITSDEFSQLDALLDSNSPAVVPVLPFAAEALTEPGLSVTASTEAVDDEFGELENLLDRTYALTGC